MTDANEICRMDTVTLAGRIKAKELSPVEVVDAVLARLERLDPVLHAFTTVTADQARAEARRIEQDIAAGREVGPLAGVPTGVGLTVPVGERPAGVTVGDGLPTAAPGANVKSQTASLWPTWIVCGSMLSTTTDDE